MHSRFRVRLAHLLLRLGAFVQSLAIMVMRPRDLIEFSRQGYAKPQTVDAWASDENMGAGLWPQERDLLAALPTKNGRLLLLGVGGGREAIPLAEMGFDVTGVDYVAEMVEKAQALAARHGVGIHGLVQEISELNVPPSSYDVAWLFASMYSCVPTRQRRVHMVRRIASALKPGGYFLCEFRWDTRLEWSSKGRFIRRLFAAATLGNLHYEPGDTLLWDSEFIHAFSSEDAIRSELTDGGLTVVSIRIEAQSMRGQAVCRKDQQTNYAVSRTGGA